MIYKEVMTMVNYFKGFYELGIAYSPNYYGTMPYAPAAEVLLYDDNNGYCIGRMDSALPDGVISMTEQEALAEIAQAQDIGGVWFGEKLAHRWEMVNDGE